MIEKREFGQTGHLSSCILLGAAAYGGTSQAETDASLETALSYGVNHIDTAASYGEAELRLGSWIQRHGRSFFLATKTGERTADKAWEEIQRSLERLHVDQVDLLQLHNLVDPTEWEMTLGPGGALEAAVRAREQGMLRFIGVTGHGVTAAAMHLRSLKRYPFDSVLLPYSFMMAQNDGYLDDFRQLEAECQARQVAMQTIKSIVHTPWEDQPRTFNTWYRPFVEQADIDLSVHWVLGHPGLFLNSAGDTRLLPKVLDAASRFQSKPSEEQMRSQLTRMDARPLFV